MALKFAVKSGIAYGALHYACSSGVWGNSIQAENLSNDLKGRASPYIVKLKEKLPFEIPVLPRTGEVRYVAKHYYNEGVKSTFRFLQMLPCYLGQLVKKTKDTINNALEAPAKN